jgi:MoaA/NifB/PqqE/SkfB family radical SAM enzyme
MAKSQKNNRQINTTTIFQPFFKGKKRPSLQRLSDLFADEKIGFRQKYLQKLPKEYNLSSELEELLQKLQKPVAKHDFPDFLRALGVVCNQVFIGPKRLLFDISYGCNLDCVYCRRHSKLTPPELKKPSRSKQAFLPMDYFISILDDAKMLGVEEILLVGGGEPTIHPQFLSMVCEIKKRGFILSFSTNGLLVDHHLADILIEQEVDNVTFSVTGVSFETYRKTHPCADERLFQQLYRNFAYLNHRRRQRVLETDVEFARPFMIFLHVLTRDNFHEVVDMALCGAEYGFDTIWYKLVHPGQFSAHLCLQNDEAEFVRQKISSLKKLEKELGIVIDDYLDEELNNLDENGTWSGYFSGDKRCYVGWNFAYVDLSGDYSFCCGDKITGLQNDYKGFADYWFSKELARARTCARNFNFGSENIKCYNDVYLVDDFCRACDNTNFNEEMERALQFWNLKGIKDSKGKL